MHLYDTYDILFKAEGLYQHFLTVVAYQKSILLPRTFRD